MLSFGCCGSKQLGPWENVIMGDGHGGNVKKSASHPPSIYKWNSPNVKRSVSHIKDFEDFFFIFKSGFLTCIHYYISLLDNRSITMQS